MAKDEREEGITGQLIPKRKLGPKKRYEFEKKRREARKERNDPRAGDSFSQHRMTGSRGHGSEYQNTRSVREEVLVDYLIGEGFASDEKSAQAIASAMSEEWKQSIVESDALRNTIKTLEGKRDAMNANKPGSANTAAPGKQSVGAATYKAYQRLRGV